ncbi:calcium-binding protein [Jannaschia aquimarina]|uniref:Cya_1 protein n=1 Tax=Jannaschia aquimarina TaxID=935700 RepID=A0A0D1EMF1_9RHOB|nr:calcium-binding protein [Jannaschia aquimarina]KIT18161.1 Bifunctional hemolysin/adenylate cyclase precursor [Jannaschia aquimarina]SNT30702.1 Hemolysin-type calcium-binding repeat-containing protein [Jannaschia aquimarina]
MSIIQGNNVGPTNDASTISGTSGDDRLLGGGRDDTIAGNDGDDFIDGGRGRDFLLGNEGNDIVFGQAGRDVVLGGRGDDLVRGGTGFDTVEGGFGTDILEGGADDDVFVFFARTAGFADDDAEAGSAIDTIIDFEEGDSIALAKFGEIDVIVTQVGGDVVISVDVDGEGGEDAYNIAIVENTTAQEVESAIVFDDSPF